MIKPLSHNDLVKLGMHESRRGYTLNKIEADFRKKGIERKAAIKALKEIEYHKHIDSSKAKKEEASKKAVSDKQNAESKPSFLPWLILFVMVGIILYLYFYSAINLEWLKTPLG